MSEVIQLIHLVLAFLAPVLFEPVYYVVLSILIPLISATLAVGARVLDVPVLITDSWFIPRSAENLVALATFVLLALDVHLAIWLAGAAQISLLLLQRFIRDLDRRDAELQQRVLQGLARI